MHSAGSSISGRAVDDEDDACRDLDDNEELGTYRSDWVLLSRSPQAFSQAPLADAAHAIDGDTDVSLWTDDYSNVFGLLKSR